jgi:hypothetical protein
MALAEDPPVAVDESDSKDVAILKPQSQRNTDPFMGNRVRIEIDLSFDPVQTRNRKARAFDDALEPAKAISNLTERHVIRHEIPDAGAFLDKLHHVTKPFITSNEATQRDAPIGSTICPCDISLPPK